MFLVHGVEPATEDVGGHCRRRSYVPGKVMDQLIQINHYVIDSHQDRTETLQLISGFLIQEANKIRFASILQIGTDKLNIGAGGSSTR